MAEPNAAMHIAAFFANYVNFDYNPSAPVLSEFRRLKDHYGWEEDSDESEDAWSDFSAAMGKQFAMYYGSDVTNINAWQSLCVALHVDPVPDTIAECKRIIKSTHVNLVDFIDARVAGEEVRIFQTRNELRKYTRKTEKIFPKEAAKQSGVLRFLLREIFYGS